LCDRPFVPLDPARAVTPFTMVPAAPIVARLIKNSSLTISRIGR
jgi:hypothetical protein